MAYSLLFAPLLVACANDNREEAREVASTVIVVATPKPETFESPFYEVLGDEVGHYGVVAKRLRDGTSISLNPNKVFYAASLFKLGIMVEAFRQREAGLLSFDEELEVTEEDAAEDLGTLDVLGIKVGDRISVGRLVTLMIVESDNASANMLLHHVGNANVDRTLRELGLSVTSVATSALPTTAADMALLLEAIVERRGISEEASVEMQSLLRGQRWRDRIPAGVPEGVVVGNKPGTWENATHDVGIVYAPSGTYILVVLSDKSWEPGPIAELSRGVYAYFASSLE